tara:strand:+ start:579 stop:1544 length:966 start_codon:yes stop_codon:yes gene_type:complete
MDKGSLKKVKLFRVGFITFVSFIIFFYGMKFLQNENFQNSTISFKIIFKNSQGIDSGDEVRMLGKKIGFVTATNIIGENIVLDVSISSLFKNSIPIDSRFDITSVDIMGGKHLTVYPGKDTNKFILDGDTVAGKNSEVVSLTQDIGDFARTLNNMIGIEQKNQVIEAISSINQFTQDLEYFMSSNVDLITDEEKKNLHVILSNFNLISEKFKLVMDEQSDNLSASIQNFSKFTENDLPVISSRISALSEKLEIIVDNINKGEGSLAKLISDDDLYNNINNLVVNTNSLVLDAKSFTDDIKSNPKKYIRAYFAAKREDAKSK